MFSPIKNTKVYEQVIEQIKNMIIDGTLKKGDKLPSERELVEHLQVSRTSIREALRALQIIGLVECRQGEGNYIRESFENSLFEPLSMMFMLQKSSSSEIMEIRKIIEVETAALAAQRITDEELKHMKVLLDSINSNNEVDNVKIDKEFHYKVAKASRNYLIINILNAISSLMDEVIKDARRRILVDEANREVLFKQHDDIYKGLKSRNPKKASEAMKKHLDFANEYYKDF
ncbi:MULTISPECIES: FadR/GntR family transcriptional regulator [Clostridium]|uniref:GntR domain protein n=2 Tax=Clostridium TaxID=1485 RepID=A0A0E3M6J8_CLOSL|nr:MULTISPECIES: FadR/GntR family transcriptional regulator [Clostridium]AKA69613.1 GntR domain protein [Clostridium scatologenes]AWI04302.1 GntR family transcriptional regulator [Clostridium drakei]